MFMILFAPFVTPCEVNITIPILQKMKQVLVNFSDSASLSANNLRPNPQTPVPGPSVFSFPQYHIAFLAEAALCRMLTERTGNRSWRGKPEQISSTIELCTLPNKIANVN